MKIAIVNDVKVIAQQLRNLFADLPEYKIAWVAYDGDQAVKKCAKDTPDVILMDLNMPVMDGVQATRLIMQRTPCAILIVTASLTENSTKIFEAMSCGALDAVKLPDLENVAHPDNIHELLGKIKTIKRLLGLKETLSYQGKHREKIFKKDLPPLLLIGASTGGPVAIANIISQFAKNIKLATVVVQHLDEQFTNGLAKWLTDQSQIRVEIAQNGSEPMAGKVLLAGKNKHLVLTRNLLLRYTSYPSNTPFKPSVDTFFNSFAQHWPEKSAAILLTGMGNDGAKGLKRLREKDWYTVAEDRQSCIVYGMPKAAAELNAAVEIASLDQICEKIFTFFKIEKMQGGRQ